MGMWGGFGGGGGMAGGWSRETSVLMGNQRGNAYGRGLDGWTDDELGQVIDPKVVRRLFPYLLEHGRLAALALVAIVVWALTYYAQPLVVGLAIDALRRGQRQSGLNHRTS